MGLRFVEYRRRQWVLRYRDPWSGKQRIKSFSTEGEARQFEAVQAEMHIRERELMRRAKRRMSSASATKATVGSTVAFGVGDDNRLAAFQNSNTGIASTKVDTDNL